ncbi:MAG: protein-methionine-sulfoxide reductase catalytic subunit MsrP [Fluviicoccus sp.]|uniref:protein-methionine-sulfoxide reductase catalytic subunit MsrP n=1 Tax=Fluviicoccus sp. TaxID=2003552 RepID=UPI0027159D3B|nr:protein-methionine-sulfoxide reductase catalytic subunit MsrP [Fluviicoccus sp.]MDO8331160.1 protein-methionine-sulfoxide reductase catalytic subunit MsrP [Fluviicoccus sp.]
MSNHFPRNPRVVPDEVTPESVFMERRSLLKSLGYLGMGSLMPSVVQAGSAPYVQESERFNAPVWLRQKIASRKPALNGTGEVLTPYDSVTTYNNFYEFGLDKEDPAERSTDFRPDPWRVSIEGLCNKPGNYTLEDILKPHTLEDRIYRFRCVEAWSMVVPWLGFSLADLLRRFDPKKEAKYVEFTTLEDVKQFPNQRSRSLDWPYVEGLRLDEAMHPLALMAVGVYGRSLPPQNGAPLRLIVPWKYGFKSIKSIVRIRFVASQPRTTWAAMAPGEYGFYANVNPAVDHPRWSQSRERRLPASLFNPNWKPTLPFNGYAREVSSLYAGMDLRKYF